MGSDSAYSSATSGSGCTSASAAASSILPVVASEPSAANSWTTSLPRWTPTVTPGRTGQSTPVSTMRMVHPAPRRADRSARGLPEHVEQLVGVRVEAEVEALRPDTLPDLGEP